MCGETQALIPSSLWAAEEPLTWRAGRRGVGEETTPSSVKKTLPLRSPPSPSLKVAEDDQSACILEEACQLSGGLIRPYGYLFASPKPE